MIILAKIAFHTLLRFKQKNPLTVVQSDGLETVTIIPPSTYKLSTLPQTIHFTAIGTP